MGEIFLMSSIKARLLSKNRASEPRPTPPTLSSQRVYVLCRLDARFFDNKRAFMLDIKKISPIIYIWYEGGWLSPPVVTVLKTVGG